MSATEEKGNNNDEETALNDDMVNLNTEIRSVSEIQDVTPTISSETTSAMSKIIPQSLTNITEELLNKESGDTKVEKTTENLINIDKKNQEPILLDASKGSGDHPATSQPDSSTIEDESSVVEKKEESLMDVSADITDEMELKWDDDDDDKSAADDILLEEQLLQDDNCNTEVSKNIVKDTKPIDENILEEINTNAENTQNKSETDVVKTSEEIDKINSPLQTTVSIDQPIILGTGNNDEIAKVDTVDITIEHSLDKTAVLSESSQAAGNTVLEDEKEVNKDLSQEVDIKKVPEDPNTGDKLSNTDTETKIISDDDLNRDESDELQEIVDSPITNKIPESELDVPMDEDDNEQNGDVLVGKVINSPETKIADPDMDVSMDNTDDVNEDELLKDDENQVLGDGETQNKTDEKLLKVDENQDLGNDESHDKIDDNVLKYDRNQVEGDDMQSIDDKDKTGDELLKEDVNQVVCDNNKDKIGDELLKDDESHDKIGEEKRKDDEVQNKIGDKLHKIDETPKDVENQVMEVDDQNKKSDDTDAITTNLDVAKSSVEDRNKIDDDINPIPTNLNKVVKEKVDKTPSTSLDVVSSNKSGNIALDIFVKEFLSVSTKNIVKDKILDDKEKITTDKNKPKAEKNILTEVSTQDITKETKMDDKSKELSNVTPKSPEKVLVEVNPDISETVENIKDEEITNTIENNDNSKVIILEDSKTSENVLVEEDPDISKTVENVQDEEITNKIENNDNSKVICLEDSKTSENVLVKVNPDISNTVENVPEEEITKTIENNDKSKVISLEDSKASENVLVEVNPDITNTVKIVQDEGITNKIENNDNSKVICFEDSPVHIKAHRLHKPDVMLDIPSQEFIDIDAELSISLDPSVPDSPEMMDKTQDVDMTDDNIKDLVEQLEGRVGKETVVSDKTDVVVKDTVALDTKENDEQIKETIVLGNKEEKIKDTVVLDNTDKEIKDAVVVDKGKEIKETVVINKDQVKDIVVQETVEEEMERIFAEDSVVKETECIATPSTSNVMAPDTSDLQEMTDSLGLLAESVRVRDAEGDAVDDDDDDHYESSNQVSPYQSDDSNAPQSETDAVRDQQEKEFDSPDVKEHEFQFTISNVESAALKKIGDIKVENTEIDEMTKASVLLKDGEESNEETIKESLDQEQQMDIDTVKLSDTSDSEELSRSEMKERDEKTPEREQKTSPSKTPSKSSPYKQSPGKMKKLEIKTLQPNQIVNIVDLQESSSSEDESHQPQEAEELPSLPPSPDNSVTNVNIPSGIEVMASGGTTSQLLSKRGDIVVSNVPKPKPHPPARLNTSEVTIKTVSHSEPMVIPETKLSQLPPETQVKPKLGLEIFSLDSDDEDNGVKEEPQSPIKQETPVKRPKQIKCMNYSCTSGTKVPFIVADARIMAFYETGRKRRTMVCQNCADAVYDRAQNLIEGIKKLTPLLELQLGNQSHELVEISDSESEDDEEVELANEGIGEKTAKFLEDNLANIFNDTWKKYDLETRLKETQILLEDEMDQLERDTKDLDKVFDDYQQATDTLRRELYDTFRVQREELPPLTIVDRPGLKFIGRETNIVDPIVRAEKRRKPTVNEQPAKRPAIPLGYAPLEDASKDKIASESKLDEDKDISVVRLSMELAPADLPLPGIISRPPLRVGMPVYAMKNAFGPWLKGRILEIQPRVANTPNSFSLCRVKFDHKTKTNAKILPARCVAYAEPSDVRMTIGTRLIALFKDSNKRESYYSGVVAEIPNPVNSYRYLVFFDDGYAQYVHHPFTRLVCESSPLVWEEVHPFSRDFVMEYLLKYPERPMVRLHEGQHLKTEWNGKWWPSRVSKVDASLAQVMFVGDGRREWIYRGSTRLAPLYLALRAAERHRPRPMPRSKAQPGSNMPYVEYTRSDEQDTNKQPEAEPQTEEIRHQRAVAKKSTSSHIPPPRQEPLKLNSSDAPTKDSRVVYYTPKNAVKPYKMTPHRCGPHCKRSDVLTLKELRTYNPLAKPLLSGWERQLVRFKGQREVMYRAPCGRRLRNMKELHHYLRLIDCELPVDLFDFNPMMHCLAEFVMSKCLVGKKDLSHGKENVPVPCVNFFDESLPEFCSYNTERTPTAGVPLNLDPEFLCGCDCTDDCADKEKCACWRMTLEGAKTIGLEGPNVGYVYKRLPEPLPSGIYECNSRCKCKDTCLNRVAQHPLQLKLQVFKTENRGWGIRALNDVPKGSFLCVYAGNLLTDATANLDGLNEGDEYLAELDYIEVVEQMKEGYEEDIPEADKKLDKKDQKQDDDDDDESESSSSEDDDTASKTDKEDDDFRPGYIGLGVTEFNKRLRRRSSKKVKEESAGDKDASTEKSQDKSQEKKDSNADEDCITISDDEEVREPSSFTVKAGMGANDFVSKYRSVRSYFGEDEACYIMDAKVQGNIGRYLNHSCCPNVFVQNVFVDTHDPRFPWVAFFALSHIKAGTELTWNYNYDVGSVPGKVLYCYCDAPNCRGRLL